MLDDKILKLARKAAVLQVMDLDDPLARSVGGIKAKMHVHGHMYLYLIERRGQLLYRSEIEDLNRLRLWWE